MYLILKMGHRIPELMIRALAGDLWAIAILSAMGVSVVRKAVKESASADHE